MSFVIFLGALAAIVLVAVVVSRIIGARAQYLDAWKPEEGEHIRFEDRRATIDVDPQVGRGERYVRSFVVVTDRRIVAGSRALFGKRLMILFMMYVGRAPGEEADSLHGGLLTRGYRTLVLEPAVRRVLEGRRPHVELTPAPAKSSLNLETIRIYTDRAADFRLPDPWHGTGAS